MGCWGVKAFESDEGLDALEWIRNHIPEDGCLHLKELLGQLKLDEWCDRLLQENGESHSSTMADGGTDGKLSKWYDRRMGVSPEKLLRKSGFVSCGKGIRQRNA